MTPFALSDLPIQIAAALVLAIPLGLLAYRIDKAINRWLRIHRRLRYGRLPWRKA